MSLDLPEPLLRYFAYGDRTASAPLFAPDAVVLDEGRVHRGTEAIAAWLQSVEQRYHPRYQLINAMREGTRTLVTFEVSGTFPGSPAKLQQALVTDGKQIVSLETL